MAQSMIELWGIRRDYFQRGIGGPFDPEDTRERVATFSSEKQALDYVRGSELNKGVNAFICVQRGHYRFRKGSLLRYYDDYEIVPWETTSVPHDPTMEKK
jgi:hypothetical protein